MRFKLFLKGRSIAKALRRSYKFRSLKVIDHPLYPAAQQPGRATWRVRIIRLDGQKVIFDILPAGRRSYIICCPNNDPDKSWQAAHVLDDLQEITAI